MSEKNGIIEFCRNFLVFFSFFAVIVGLIGNCISYKIYSQSLRKNTLSIYFRTMSVFNNLVLFYMLIEAIQQYFGWDIRVTCDMACRTFDYGLLVVGAIPGWLLVPVSADRFLHICRPNRYPLFFEFKFQLGLISFIIGYNLALYSPNIWNSQMIRANSSLNHSLNVCKNDFVLTNSWLDMFNSTIVPFVFMILFTVLLIYYVRQSREKTHHTHGGMKDRKFAITAITLNMLFLVLNLPITIVDLLITYANMSDYVMKIVYFLTITCFYVFFAADFYVQFTFNSVFREKFFLLFDIRLIDIPISQIQNKYVTS